MPRFAWLIDLAVAIKCFGVGCSYLIVIGDLMPEVRLTATADNCRSNLPFLQPSYSQHYAAIGMRSQVVEQLDPTAEGLLVSRHAWLTAGWLLIAAPLSCLKTLDALKVLHRPNGQHFLFIYYKHIISQQDCDRLLRMLTVYRRLQVTNQIAIVCVLMVSCLVVGGKRRPSRFID